MPTIARVRWEALNIDYGWMFKLGSFGELQDYWEKVRSNRFREGFANYQKSREYQQLIGKADNFSQHLTSDDALFFHAKALAEAYKDQPRSLVEVFAEVTDEVYRGMLRVLSEKGCVYANRVGGYLFLSGGLEEVESRQISEYILPDSKIRIKQWNDGKHYYAYVGDTSVTWNGVNKWSTKEMAQIAAEKWLKSSGQNPASLVD